MQTTDGVRELGPYAALLADVQFPPDETENSPALLYEALYAIEQKFPIVQKDISTIAERVGDKVYVDTSLPLWWDAPSGKRIPLAGMFSTYALLVSGLVARTGISETHARTLAWSIHKACIEAFGENWTAYVAFLKSLHVPDISPDVINAATAALCAQAEVDYTYDCPTLAFYAKETPRKIYIDKDFPRVWKLESGESRDVSPYLVMHEMLEKTLMDEIKFSSRSYQRTHQISQQIEKIAVEAAGISWEEYQYKIMVPELDRAYEKKYTHLPLASQVDITAYYDLGETYLIDVMERKGDQSFFTVSTIREGVYHLYFEDNVRMAATLMRFQEFYESQEFRGKYFTREEFLAWYATTHEGETYTQHWADEGFNFPSSALKPFYEGKFAPLTADEAAVLEHFRTQGDKQFYIIATAEKSDVFMLGHEIAHALYYLDQEYKEKVEAVLARADTERVKAFLRSRNEYNAYHEAVLDDEVHAYLGHHSEELAGKGFDIAPYAHTISELQQIYREHAPRV